MKRQTILWILVGLGTALGVLIGCHAQPDDPAGQAEELADPVRRENAVSNLQTLYSNALASAQKATQNDGRNPRSLEEVPGDDGRARPGPKKIADASVEALVRTYVDHPEDTQNGGRIVALLREMHDPRALPAFTQALEWRAEISEDHAVTAAQAIEDLELTEAQKGPLVEALATALERIQGNRGDDNRMRIHFIRTLRHLEDRRATPVLTKIATRMAEDQAFTINRLAAEALADLGDPAAIPTMINALFLFAPNNPMERMNDIGGQGLVQIGEPALAPTLALLRGENADATRIATSYIRAIQQRNADAASKMDPRSTVIEESCYALGQIGLRAGIDPMMEHVSPLTAMSVADATGAGEAQRQAYSRALTCTTTLIQNNREESDTPRLRQTIIDVYQRIPEEWPP
jgi:HEAT repeat protein